MAELIKVNGSDSGYREILDTLMTKGRKQESRVGNTLEIEDMVIELCSAKLGVIGKGPYRQGYQETIGMVEGLQLIAGVSDSSLTCEIQPNFRHYMDDGLLHGAYGPRTVNQFPIIIERLRRDPDTRQAIITLWNPEYDGVGGKKDHPCTTAFNFRIRGDRLNMTTFMRSNDCIMGYTYDIYQFAMVQGTVANVLGLKVGTYTHHAASFHIYEQHWDMASKMLSDGDVWPNIANVPAFGCGVDTWEEAREEARDVWHVVRSVKPVTAIRTPDQAYLAHSLMERKLENSGKTALKIRNRVTE